MASYMLRRIDPELWAKVKTRCRQQIPNVNPKDVIEALLRDWLAPARESRNEPPAREVKSEKAPMRLLGTVIAWAEGFYEIECPAAPAHLTTLFLRKWQASGVEVGDGVILEYQTTVRSGLWNVVQVVKSSPAREAGDDFKPNADRRPGLR